MVDTYIKIIVKDVPRDAEELVSGVCFDYGALGVSENLSFRQTSLKYEPELVPSPLIDLEVYFSTLPEDGFQVEVLRLAPKARILFLEEENKDWMEEWKKGFEAFEMVDNIWVVPSWLEIPEQAKASLRIDPGMAFGTGTHETTKLASQGIHKLISENKIQSVMDVGTGTGLLAMLAAEMGVKKIQATEIEPEARRVAKENVALNNYVQIEVLDYQIEKVEDKFDLVVANIIDGVLIEIQQFLKEAMQTNGLILLTGILKERESIFTSEFHLPENYKWIQRKELGEWVSYIGGPE